jgi:hypothetical protein
MVKIIAFFMKNNGPISTEKSTPMCQENDKSG